MNNEIAEIAEFVKKRDEVLNNLIKDHYELVDCLFTKEEITCIANCLAVACFDNEKAKAIMSKLEKQKEWAKNNVD